MKSQRIRQLRAIMNRYGAAGVLFVGGILAAHHAWQHRRKTYIAAATIVLALFAVFLARPAHTPPTKRQVPAALPVVLDPPSPSRLHLNLQDDTQPGPPLSPAIPNKRVGNGFIVFAATFYHKSGQFYKSPYSDDKEETLEGHDQPSHIYRINADGSRLRQLTWGDASDENPYLSPDGQRVVFTRSTEKYTTLCWLSIYGGQVHALLSASSCEYPRFPSWSPDGKWLALDPARGQDDDLRLVSLVDRQQIRLANIREAAWSPDGRLYVRDAQDHARIFRPGSSVITPVQDVVRHAAWLDNHTLAGDIAGEEHSEYGRNFTLRIINDRGAEIEQKSLRLIGEQNGYETFNDIHEWYCLPQHPNTLILETRRYMSDGPHFGCFRVDARTGEARLLEDGRLIGIAPDGSQVAVADQAWIGPYKRGGARVGPLKIVSLASGRSHAVTHPLSCIGGGDWQAASPAPAPSVRIALLRAIETGDSAQARFLLARGVSANAHYRDGMTALMIAAGEGNSEMVRLLLRFHADPNRADKFGNTALMAAVGGQKAADETPTTRQVDIGQALIQAGARIDTRNSDGQNALMEAASKGRAIVVDWLLRHGAQVNAHDNDGWTALIYAAHRRYSHTTQTLLDHGATVNLRNKLKETALSIGDERSCEDDGMTTILLKQAGAVE